MVTSPVLIQVITKSTIKHARHKQDTIPPVVSKLKGLPEMLVSRK